MNLHDKNILLIEDDKHIYSLIKAMLKPYDTNLTLKMDGESGLKSALSNNFDLVLLDIMLPKIDGWEICRQIKDSTNNIPIIMLTAKVEETDKVLGLEMGADDYVTKPFSPRELTARIKAVLRRYENSQSRKESEEKEKQLKLTFPEMNLTIDINNYNVNINDNSVTLTPKEFELLALLAQNEEQVFRREQLLDQIWGFDNYSETRTIDEHIKRLRKKLNEAGLEKVPIKTVWGVGYKFSLEDDTDET
ncbi:MAG: response regulator transcription factor [Halanaerobiales bacterium]